MPDIMSFGRTPGFMAAIDLIDCPNGEVTLTIASITEKSVNNGRGETSKESACAWKEKGWLPMILNVTNKKVLVKLLKTKDTSKMVGKRVTVTTEHGRWFGKEGDALRIKPILPPQTAPTKAAEIKCEQCGQNITAAYNMQPDKLAQYTLQKFGKRICAACAEKAAKDGAESAG